MPGTSERLLKIVIGDHNGNILNMFVFIWHRWTRRVVRVGPETEQWMRHIYRQNTGERRGGTRFVHLLSLSAAHLKLTFSDQAKMVSCALPAQEKTWSQFGS